MFITLFTRDVFRGLEKASIRGKEESGEEEVGREGHLDLM